MFANCRFGANAWTADGPVRERMARMNKARALGRRNMLDSILRMEQIKDDFHLEATSPGQDNFHLSYCGVGIPIGC